MPIVKQRKSLDWVEDRIKHNHHKALTKYLLHRTEEETFRDLNVGITAQGVLEQVFHLKNGMTTVPMCALQLLKNLDDISAEKVWDLCYKSIDDRQKVNCVNLLEKLSVKRPHIEPVYLKARNQLIVEKIMKS